MTSVLNEPKRKIRAMRACSHCGVPTLADVGVEDAFCCNGCMGAFQLIHRLGFEDYYSLKSNSGANMCDLPRVDPKRLSILENLETAGVVVHRSSDGLCSVRLSIDGIHCAACTWLIDRLQTTIPGLDRAQVRMSDHSIELIYDPLRTQPIQIAQKLAKLGYLLSPWVPDPEDDHGFIQQQREHWFQIALATFFAANSMWIGVALYAGESTGMSAEHEYFLRWVGTVLALLAVAFPGRLFFLTAWQAMRSRTPHIDIPVAIALLMGTTGSWIGAWTGVGHIYFDSLASLILLLRVGRYIQFRAQYQTSLSLAKLLRWNTNTACRLEADGTKTRLPAGRLQVGDTIEILPGETLPADGIITEGSSYIDWSLMSGEGKAQWSSEGAILIAGTTNLSAPLKAIVTDVGANTRIGKLMNLVRDASSHRTRSIDAADLVSKWFVLVVLLLGVGTFSVWTFLANSTAATEHTMALLTIACPCALALAAPLVLTVAMGRAARKQIWIRDGSCLERMANPGMLWLDKTGTLTHGRLQVLEFHGEDDSLCKAMAIERSVQHPVASAICDFAAERSATRDSASNVEFSIGRGASGIVNGQSILIGTQAWLVEHEVEIPQHWLDLQKIALERNRSIVWLAAEGQVCGLFETGDPLRTETVDALRTIAGLGWRLGILSGDRQEIVDGVASELRGNRIPIHSALGQQSPEDKFHVIRQTKNLHKGPCAMVGDGVNDAAALSIADIGIAIRGGSEQALLAAPIFLANGRLESVAELMTASMSVVRGIRRCFIASLIYNTFTLTLAMLGYIHPLIAAVLMPISGLTVLTMAMSTKAFYKKN